LHDLHVLRDIGEDSGLNEVALVAMAATTGLNLGTSLLAGVNVRHDAVKLNLRNLRSLEGPGVMRVTNNVLGGSLLESLDELVINALLDVNSRASAAALAVVEEDTEVDPRDSVVDVSIVEDDVW